MTKNSNQSTLSQKIIVKDDLKKKTNKPEAITSLDDYELLEGEFFDDMGVIRQGSIF